MMTTFEDLFLSTGIVGYIGPLALVAIGAYLMKKDKVVGLLYFIVECLVVAQYASLVEATPDYYWHMLIVLLGGLFTFVYPLWERR